jgi:hypothetical protein
LYAVNCKFADDLLLVIGKHGCNMTHDFSIEGDTSVFLRAPGNFPNKK